MTEMDTKLFWLIYNFTQRHAAVGKAAAKTAALSEGFYFAAYAAGGIWLLLKADPSVTGYIVFPCGALCLNMLLRRLINRTRPFVRFALEPAPKHKKNGSLPSNHAACAMVISLSLFAVSPLLGAALAVLAVFTGISRICIGVHYPLDVLAGWLLGAVFGIVGIGCL